MKRNLSQHNIYQTQCTQGGSTNNVGADKYISPESFIRYHSESYHKVNFKFKTILGAGLFLFLLTNTNIARIKFFMTQHGVVLLIMDIESEKSDVNGPKKKVCLWHILI